MKEYDPIVRLAVMLRDAQRAVCLTGAGISTPSGIPDFRSSESGLWSQVNPMEGFGKTPELSSTGSIPLLD